MILLLRTQRRPLLVNVALLGSAAAAGLLCGLSAGGNFFVMAALMAAGAFFGPLYPTFSIVAFSFALALLIGYGVPRVEAFTVAAAPAVVGCVAEVLAHRLRPPSVAPQRRRLRIRSLWTALTATLLALACLGVWIWARKAGLLLSEQSLIGSVVLYVLMVLLLGLYLARQHAAGNGAA